MMKPSSLEKPSSVVEQIYRSLSRAIQHQELKPGTPLTEAELQEWFGVSRAPIREAIRLLESEGLVVVNAFKKKYVRKLTSQELDETFTVLACLEGFAANLAAERITDEQLTRLEENIGDMEAHYKTGDLNGCAQLNFEFHSTIIKAALNSVLRKTISSIMKAPGWYWLTRTYYQNSLLVTSSIADHRGILEALRLHDPEKAERSVRIHFANIKSNWRDQM